MAALQAAAAEHDVGLDQCWAWSSERLAQVLSWPEALLEKVERYRQQQGASPQLKIPSDVLTPLDELWPQALNRLDRPPLVLHQQGRAEIKAPLRSGHSTTTRAQDRHTNKRFLAAK